MTTAHARRAALVLLFLILVVTPLVEAKTVVGFVERVALPAAKLVLDAKIDTGATHSSLSATDVTEFQRAGRTWVRFTVVHAPGQAARVEAPHARTARIRRHQGQSESRRVVTLSLCLGSIAREVEVNLVDRAGFDYPLLVGRSFLAGEFIVDPAIQGTLEPACGLLR